MTPNTFVPPLETSISHPSVVAIHSPRSQPVFEEYTLVARWVDDVSEIESLKKQWVKLQEHAVYRNAAHEYSYLMPAIKHLGTEAVRLLVVEKQNAESKNELVGLMPLEFKKIYGLPFKGIEIWKHEQSFDTTPLLHRDFATEAWQACCEFLGREKVALISLDTVSAEPAFESVLNSTQQKLKLGRFQRETFNRAALVPAESAEEYKHQHLSKNARKKQQQQDRKLSQLGEVKYKLSSSDADWEFLTNEFMRLEASGWKGKNGTALNSDPQTEAFYRELIRESAAAGKARFLTLNLDGVPIAMLSDIQTDSVVYSYKTAFDDNFKKYSPGKQCELKNIEFLHDGEVEIADSCTAPDNETLNRIWGQKLAFQNVIFSLKPGITSYVVRLLPSMQYAVRRLKSGNGD